MVRSVRSIPGCMVRVSRPEREPMGYQPLVVHALCGAAHDSRLLAILPVMKSSNFLLRRCSFANSSHRTRREKKRCSMQQSFLSARVGPMIGLVGSSIVLIYYFLLPLNSLVSEWDGTPWQGTVDPMVVVVLLTALAVLILSVVALFLPHSPVLGGLG